MFVLLVQVCAPRMTSRIKEDQWSIESIVNGICYWTPDTNGTQPTIVRRIAPLRLTGKCRNNNQILF